jgi:hypothetical protein
LVINDENIIELLPYNFSLIVSLVHYILPKKILGRIKQKVTKMHKMSMFSTINLFIRRFEERGLHYQE